MHKDRRPLFSLLFVGIFLCRCAAAQDMPAAPVLNDRISAVEAEIGSLMQKRVDDAGGVPRELELRIDVRIVARWMLSSALKAPAGSELQSCAWIRASDLLAAARLVEKELAQSSRPAAVNTPHAKALHDLTFKLGEAGSVEQLDAASRTTALALLAVTGADPAKTALPAMRPPPLPQPAAPSGPRSVEQLALRARELAVSQALRVQLLAFSQMALQLANDPKAAEQFAQARAVLDEAITLAEGLHVNTAVEREERVQMEAQVAQGLAMYLDPRTRELGQRRVAGLGQYRQLLGHVRAMKLSADLLRRFGPALTWARRNPEKGSALLQAFELFIQQDARLASLPAGSELTGAYAKAAEDAKRRAAAARDTFIDAASSSTFFRNPENLRAQAESMRKALDARAAIARTPEAIRILSTYRPKPFGGIEKRVQTALSAWSSDTAESDRDAATSFLIQLARLGDYAAELNRPASAPANDEVIRQYAGGSLQPFSARHKAVVTELINATAAGAALDEAAFAGVETARTLLATLQLAGRAEQALEHADVLRRWVDWGIDREQLDTILQPYRAATAGAFEGFVNSDTAAVKDWAALRAHFEPLLALLGRIAGRAEECRGLPAGRTGALAKLVTPLNNQPYAVERLARFALDVCDSYRERDDDKTATATLAALAARLPR